ncbi:MAG: MerR family transcriptional regulator [Chloroflexi bacterium]|nr:MerR family transcriptional regulator [Chloroflexota bacterium]MDA1002037.1 MerR family transcriptional regulator [Chloroflexota bacterium]
MTTENLSDDNTRYQIGEVAEKTGVTQRTLRFYEEKGLLKPPERMDGGFRLYSDTDVKHIEFIKRLQDLLGFTLSEIKEMVEAEELRQQIVDTFRPDRELPARRQRTEQIIDALERQLTVVERKVEQLTEMQKELRERLTHVRGRRQDIVDAIEHGGTLNR